jgi:choline dehydrogenase
MNEVCNLALAARMKIGRMREFAYVIVGAGSAGCVLANRLSADPDTQVLLVEAGGRDTSLMVRMPAGIPELLGKPNPYNWYLETEPQPHLNDRRLYWPRGRGWGGSSSINGMIYVRGQAEDYDRWRQMGLTGWSFEDVLPYFKRSETNENGPDAFHGGEGPLFVSNGRSKNPLFGAFVEGGIEAGHARAADFNGPVQEGFGRYQLTIRNGRRWSAACAYLHSALKRPNLQVESFAHATRILFERDRAVGVEYVQNGQVVQVRAAGEVLLCGGAVHTPQLLMLSGVGDSAVLTTFGIPVRAELKGVGKNLQDHLDCSVQYECRQPITLFSQTKPLKRTWTGLRYLLLGSGIGTSQGLETGAFLRSRSDLETPDLQLHFIAGLMFDHTRKKADRHGFMAHVCYLRPQSRGYISLRSADPLVPPLIQPNYLEAAQDMWALREGVKLTREVFAQQAFDSYRGPELMPGTPVKDDAAIDEFIRMTAETIYHPVGSAKMGVGSDAVVDAQLKVHGLAGLRIADASVMPEIISGNTNAPTIMIAEKAADMIRLGN